ncbi:MAG: sulfurtransferase-like selenium metabolism protein YedF [Bacillota bacterium]|uniref:sulfurtransferase-like selenium metabolism protein YedF n=1 Tax=Desulfurispora thermophila TaxID=265470 RepID=UPI00036E08B1|nr:sulfurtransferase-like selenium metabolism protein YedF [Desulfurispora thermophila]
MSKFIVDCRGLACPQPVLKTQNALRTAEQSIIEIIVDNAVAKENVSIFLANAGENFSWQEKDGLYHFTVIRDKDSASIPKPEEKPTATINEAPVYLVTTNVFGQGAPDLGQTLMKSLMVTLVESDPVPKALLFLNSGVFLTCQGSPVLEQLKKLLQKGTTIISCGTCLDYYKLKEKLAVGRIGNMLEINQFLTSPGQTITIA